eukprot:c46029_g1_i1.p1 GENE.c46029_g1_i1~~c46029_g1_i1.p1  ORF type:complete len:418 (-),score=85.36 c46029_g1_i1:62-1315(-)
MFVMAGYRGGTRLFVLETGQVTSSSAERIEVRNLATMKIENVTDWLLSLGLHRYRRVFVKAEVDLESLIELDDEDLKEIGVESVGPRKVMCDSIQKMRDVKLRRLQDRGHVYRGRYKILERVSVGACNTACTATDLKTNSTVLLKFQKDAELFRHEVAMLSLLRSQFVVELLDYYEEPPNVLEWSCIVLEYPRYCLDKKLAPEARTHLGINERKYIFDRVGRIVQHLHANNVAHCNLNADCLQLFGMRWKMFDVSSAQIIGTPLPPSLVPHYPSPEFVRLGGLTKRGQTGEEPILADPAADIWALGVMLSETFLIDPKGPSTILRADALNVSTLANFEEIDTPRMVAGADEQAAHLVKKMLLKNPLDRANITAVLRHAYFVGGTDTEQVQGAFGHLQAQQRTMQAKLAKAFTHVAGR